MRDFALKRIVLAGLTLLAVGLASYNYFVPRQGAPIPEARTPMPAEPLRTLPAPVTPTGAFPDYGPLKAAMQRFIAGFPGMTYGIYFMDLKTGAGFGINDTWLFPAASCIKVPLVLYLNQLVDNGRLSWQDKVVFSSDLDWQGGAGALQFFATDGTKYSLRCLATLTITLSDNISTRMLLRYLGKDNFIRFLKSMGAQYAYPNGENKATPRDMGLYVRAVINYARNHADGQRLLDDMANTIWHVGLPGQLPARLVVAHKEGDLTGVAADIGVVYSARPYVLTVMSTGVPDEYVGFGNIASISKLAYDYQESLR